MDTDTKDWIRNASDELAARAGCRFDGERARFVVDWIQDYCCLYEGDCAGQPLVLSDWQLECTMRLFGWVKWSEKWQREVRRFRQASIWIAKKNKKSPTLAAWGLYLLCGDGEMGQKVFLAAKDGKQAREIAGAHAVEMVRQSPELDEVCTINLNLLRITHEPSRSYMQPLSSANARTKQSKEGLNGSVLIDETHVVDRDFINRISRAGISRSEPLRIEVSTAGDNPDGYGMSRFTRAVSVERGDVEDEELFAAVYAAPQDLSDEELDKDPLKYCRMANPALGHTVDPAEFLVDYHRSKTDTLEEFGKCKMYRLNIWQNSANPLIRESDWQKCGKAYEESDLLGKECYAGFDASLKWDTSCIMLAFPWGDDDKGNRRYRLWPYFFLPEVSARKTRDKVQWFEFEKNGHLILTEGDVTDFPLIRRTFQRIKEKFDLRLTGYDDKFAEYFAQQLQDEDGLEMKDYNQNPGNFLEPLALFEAGIIAGTIEHPNNTCLNWQVRNAHKNRRGMLDKPPDEDHKKIDGVVAAVMALGIAMEAPAEKGWDWDPADGIYL